MRVIILDCAEFKSRTAAHRYIKRKLGFPEYYGENLDALHDCLSELASDTAVVILNADFAGNRLGEYAEGVFEVFYEVLVTHCRAVIL